MRTFDNFFSGLFTALLFLMFLSFTTQGKNYIKAYMDSDFYKTCHCFYVDNFVSDMSLKEKVKKEFFCRF